jgi:hypothetical protein
MDALTANEWSYVRQVRGERSAVLDCARIDSAPTSGGLRARGGVELLDVPSRHPRG